MQALTLARTAGALMGAGVAAFAIGSWQIDRGTQTPPAALTLTSASTGELAVAPTGKVLVARRLELAAPHRARFSVRNQTGSELRVRLRGSGPEHGLDAAVRVTVAVDGGRVLAGPLVSLRRGVSLGSFAAGTTRKVEVTTSLERTKPAIVADLKLELTAKAVS